MTESLMPVAVRSRKLERERVMTARRVARWRAEKGRMVPDSRRCDMAISEALAVYAATLPPEQATALLREVVRLAADGLAYKNFDRKLSKRAVGKRLVTWTSPVPHAGSVRAAKALKSLTGTVTP